MKRSFFKVCVILWITAATSFAQHGGKAEPKRLNTARGGSITLVTGTLSTGQEAEHIFAAKEGELITVTNSNTGLFDFRIFISDGSFDSEFDSSKTLTVTAQKTGDYLLFVRKKKVKSPKTAKFSLTLSIN